VEEIICDTDVMIDYFNPTKQRHLNTKQCLESKIGLSFVTLTPITKMELIIGVQNKVDLAILNKKIKHFNILLVNQEITSIALGLLENYKLSHNLAMADSLIAATAIFTGVELFTYNRKDFQFISALTLYNI